jgi:hypothetical protein
VFNEVARHKNYIKENPRFQGTCTRQTPDGRESEAMTMFNTGLIHLHSKLCLFD